jgi:hypothetical protein
VFSGNWRPGWLSADEVSSQRPKSQAVQYQRLPWPVSTNPSHFKPALCVKHKPIFRQAYSIEVAASSSPIHSYFTPVEATCRVRRSFPRCRFVLGLISILPKHPPFSPAAYRPRFCPHSISQTAARSQPSWTSQPSWKTLSHQVRSDMTAARQTSD